jgi:hypothetical protein
MEENRTNEEQEASRLWAEQWAGFRALPLKEQSLRTQAVWRELARASLARKERTPNA